MVRAGRPSLEETRGDPRLAEKAQALRAMGLSWSQVAERLGVGRTSARRLCLERSRGPGLETEAAPEAEHDPAGPPFRNRAETVPKPPHSLEGRSWTELDAMPETFRLFAKLLRRARAQRSESKGLEPEL